jgi:hypothetical protein
MALASDDPFLLQTFLCPKVEQEAFLFFFKVTPLKFATDFSHFSHFSLGPAWR